MKDNTTVLLLVALHERLTRDSSFAGVVNIKGQECCSRRGHIRKRRLKEFLFRECSFADVK